MGPFEVGGDVDPPTEGGPLFPCGFVLAESWIGHALGDWFVSSIVWRRGLNEDIRRVSLQDVGCGEVYQKWWSKLETNRWVSHEVVLESTFSTPVVWDMYSWMSAWCVIQADSIRSGPTDLSDLTMNILEQLSITVLSTLMGMGSKGVMWGGKKV